MLSPKRIHQLQQMYDVGNNIKDPSVQNTEIPLKKLMLKHMKITSQELKNQYDAAECI